MNLDSRISAFSHFLQWNMVPKQIRRVPFSFQYTDLTLVAIKLGNSLQHGVEAQYFMQWYSHWMFSSSSNFWPSFNFYLYIPPPPPPPPPVEPSETSTKIDLCRFNRSFIAVEYASSDLNVSTRRTKTKSWEWKPSCCCALQTGRATLDLHNRWWSRSARGFKTGCCC